MTEKKNKYVLPFVILLCFITSVAILFDIPVFRQVLGFIFITLLPGRLIIQILKLDNVELTERFVLSVGLSISFIMIFGVVLNNTLYSLGYLYPLSKIALLVSFNIVILSLYFFVLKTNPISISTMSFPTIHLNPSDKVFLIVPILSVALSIFGMNLLNTTGNNTIILVLFLLIAVYITLICIFAHKFSPRLYPIVIFLISISLLLLLSLRSHHLIGVDTHTEFYIFQTTLNNYHWKPFIGNALDACLSISLLPTIYQSLLNVHSEFLFKILYSLLYSISPVIIYIISKKYVKEIYAFLGSCFYMFQISFLWNAANARTNIAILFFILSIMVLFNDKINIPKKRLLLTVFMISCVLSHYSTTYIFFFVMAGTIIGVEILSTKYEFKRTLSFNTLILFFSLIFVWYSQLTGTAFNAGINFIQKTLSSFHLFFLEESREMSMQSLQGGWLKNSFPYIIEFTLLWLTFLLIGLGIATMIIMYKEMSSLNLTSKKPSFLKEKFDVEYTIISLFCSLLLFLMFILPSVSKNYAPERLYAFSSGSLSVFFVIGGIVAIKLLYYLINRIKRQTVLQSSIQKSIIRQNYSQIQTCFVILIILIPYFFSITGVTYYLSGEPRSIFLDSKGTNYDKMYVYDQETSSAKWLKNHYVGNTSIYSDFWGYPRLLSQAGFSPNLIDRVSLVQHKEIDGYIYLRYQNIVGAELVGRDVTDAHNLTEYKDVLISKNKIYCNDGSEILK